MKKKWIMTAAALMLMVLMGTSCSGHPGGAEPAGTGEPVEIGTLLRSGPVEAVLIAENVKINGKTAVYGQVLSGDSDRLSRNLGEKLNPASHWYQVAGHGDKQYLIHYADGEYTLWDFVCFTGSEYPYSDVLENIYNIHSAADIKKIAAKPDSVNAVADSTQLKREIGTVNIMDEEEIEDFYNVISAMTCYGENNWEMIDLGDGSDEGMLNRVRKGRFLTLVNTDGVEFDSLKYTGVSGMFYEYGGIAYSPLSAEDKAVVDSLLKIE